MSSLKDALTAALGQKAITEAPEAQPVLTCTYCNKPARLVTGKEIYPRRPDLFSLSFWQCKPCDAYVGCHKAGNGYGDGTRPLGILANKELRALKLLVHRNFDMLWQGGAMKRNEAYAWLAGQLNIPVNQCHVGMFTVDLCKKAAEVANKKLMDLPREHGLQGDD